MSTGKTLLLIVGLLVVAGLVVGLTMFGEDVVPDEPLVATGTARIASAVPEPPAQLTEGAEAWEAENRARLLVEVVDDRGRLVEDATIEAVGPGGIVFRDKKRVRWTGLEPGEWTLTVASPDFLPSVETLTLEAGSAEELRVELSDSFRLVGAVKTRFGRPLGTRTVWLLAPGQLHPQTKSAGKELLSTTTDASGRFAIAITDPGEYRLSVGPAGRADLSMSTPVTLEPGGANHVGVVVATGTMLEVKLQNLLSEAAGGKRPRISILGLVERSSAERKASRPDPGALLDPTTKGKKGRLKGQRTGGRDREGGAPDGQTKPTWKEVANGKPSEEGTASFHQLEAGVEYRLRLTVGEVRYDSTESFRLDANLAVTVFADMPPPPPPTPPVASGDTAEKPAKPEPLPLSIYSQSAPPVGENRQAGFHWR